MSTIRSASQDDVKIVANLVGRLLAELSGEEFAGADEYIRPSSNLLADNTRYLVFLAFNDDEKCVGLMSLSESYAVYTLGKFGIIQELYVDPEYRSTSIGSQLMQHGIRYAQTKDWSRLEVGTPDPEAWGRTIGFYKRNGFISVGQKMKLVF